MLHEELIQLTKAITATTAGDKTGLAARLLPMLRTYGSPVIDGTTVTFFYHGKVQQVGIVGDMTDWCKTEYFQRVTGTDLFYWQTTLPADARLEYNLQIDCQEALHLDPLNPFVSLNGLGPLSELAMPGYRYHPLFEAYRSGQKGKFERITTHQLAAGALGYPHTIHIYIPPGYAESDNRYPVVYFQDGEDYIEFAQTPFVLNQLINDGIIEPLIAVFEAPPNRHLPAAPNRMTQYGMNDDFVRFFADELAPFVDSRYRTRTAADQRLVVGPSYGGLISAYIAFQRPDVFGLAYSQSGYVSCEKDRLIRLFRESSPKQLRLYVDVGHYERCVGAAFLPMDETDFLLGNRRFRDVLNAQGYDFVYHEYPEGHTWGNWRRHLIDGLIHFFGVEK